MQITTKEYGDLLSVLYCADQVIKDKRAGYENNLTIDRLEKQIKEIINYQNL